MTMRALKAFPYNGRIYRPGDVFEPASDARHALRALQLAVEIEDEPPKKKPAKHKYSRMDMRAEDAGE
jgi:hypothetical protein